MRKLTAVMAAGLLAGAGGAALAAGGGGGGMGGSPSASAPAYDPAADYAKGVAALQAKQYADAARALKRVTSAAPSSVEAWRMLGMASAGDNDWKGSRRAFEHAVRLAPDDYANHWGLGLALARLKDPKAQEQLDWLKAKSQACGAGCADGEQLKAAAAEVAGAMAGAPAPSAALGQPMIFAGAAVGDLAYAKAVGLNNERHYDAALASLDAARAAFGPHPDILTYQGYAWRKKGDWDRAESYYRQALAVAPAHRGATEYYGELKVERGDMGGARQMLARLDTICAFGCAEAEELRRWIDHGGDPERR